MENNDKVDNSEQNIISSNREGLNSCINCGNNMNKAEEIFCTNCGHPTKVNKINNVNRIAKFCSLFDSVMESNKKNVRLTNTGFPFAWYSGFNIKSGGYIFYFLNHLPSKITEENALQLAQQRYNALIYQKKTGDMRNSMVFIYLTSRPLLNEEIELLNLSSQKMKLNDFITTEFSFSTEYTDINYIFNVNSGQYAVVKKMPYRGKKPITYIEDFLEKKICIPFRSVDLQAENLENSERLEIPENPDDQTELNMGMQLKDNNIGVLPSNISIFNLTSPNICIKCGSNDIFRNEEHNCSWKRKKLIDSKADVFAGTRTDTYRKLEYFMSFNKPICEKCYNKNENEKNKNKSKQIIKIILFLIIILPFIAFLLIQSPFIVRSPNIPVGEYFGAFFALAFTIGPIAEMISSFKKYHSYCDISYPIDTEGKCSFTFKSKEFAHKFYNLNKNQLAMEVRYRENDILIDVTEEDVKKKKSRSKLSLFIGNAYTYLGACWFGLEIIDHIFISKNFSMLSLSFVNKFVIYVLAWPYYLIMNINANNFFYLELFIIALIFAFIIASVEQKRTFKKKAEI